uniref:rRNA-processing protein FCF1 homolog n=1 Tax=Cyprinus carpio carpio TaxID=630221 RepID=A0A8C1I0A5_CYPCA
MGKQKKQKKYATMKRMISLKDQRIKEQDRAKTQKKKKEDPSVIKEQEVAKHPSCMFFQYNTQLGPPYYILVDTNFINFSIKAKLDVVQSMMDCLYAKCVPCITDCVMAELEKLGMKFRVALRIAKDPRFDRLPCSHKGTYADDCLVQRVTQHKCYIVATVDRDLKRRIRKIPGVPIMYISNHSSSNNSGKNHSSITLDVRSANSRRTTFSQNLELLSISVWDAVFLGLTPRP